MWIIPAILLALASPSFAQAQQHFPANKELEEMVKYIVEDGEAPGAVLGVLENDGSTRIASYGNSGPGARQLTSDSRFEIGSITKTFTATLLADMVLNGEVALEDPVSKYLPDHVTVPSRGGREIKSGRHWLMWLIFGTIGIGVIAGIWRWRTVSAVVIALLMPLTADAQTPQHPPVVLPGTDQRTLHSSVNGVSYKLYVSIPNDYAGSDSEYPVVYLLDADYSFAIARNIVEHISDRGQMERAIIVGIAYGGPPAYRLNRTRDYTPVFSPTGGYGPEYQRVSGGGPAFIEFISDELIPFIEQEYRATDERVLVGHSYGGLFAAWVALNHTRVFDGYIIVSPSLWYDDYMIFEEEEQRAESMANMDTEIYMGVGSLEINSQQNMPDDLTRFVTVLNSRNYPDLRLDWSIEEDDTHNSIFPIVLSDGLRFLLGLP